MKAGLYLRVSTTDQTTLNQELELKNYCLRNDIEIYNLYKDEGVSGSKTSRPQLDLMLQDMRNKCFNCWKRFGRKRYIVCSCRAEYPYPNETTGGVDSGHKG